MSVFIKLREFQATRRRLDEMRFEGHLKVMDMVIKNGLVFDGSGEPVSYTHLTLPTTPYV